MKKIIITNGLIGGIIVSAVMLASFPLVEGGQIDQSNGMIIGYTSMVVALSLVFFGIKTYRDQHLGGSITFGQAFKIGILITAIASLMYVLSWEVYYNTVASDFAQKYAEQYLEQMREEGASAAELDLAREKMDSFAEMYKNPVIRMGMTFAEILPVGLIITLISAALLRKKEILPTSPAS